MIKETYKYWFSVTRILSALLFGVCLCGPSVLQAADGIVQGTNMQADGTNASAWGNGTNANAAETTAWGKNTSATGEQSTAWGNGAVASAQRATAWGDSSIASGNNSTAFGLLSTANADNSLAALGGTVAVGANDSAAIGNGSKVSQTGTVALGNGSVANRAAGDTNAYQRQGKTGSAWVSTHNAVAVGDDANVTRQITGVAAGTKDTDAVNVAQLKAVSNQNFREIGHEIDKLENKMAKGLAANNALASLVPLDSKYKTQISMAIGGYDDNQAIAIGAFHYLSDNVLVNTGIAYGGNSSLSYGAGVTFGF